MQNGAKQHHLKPVTVQTLSVVQPLSSHTTLSPQCDMRLIANICLAMQNYSAGTFGRPLKKTAMFLHAYPHYTSIRESVSSS